MGGWLLRIRGHGQERRLDVEAECLEQCNCCKSRVKVRVVKSGVDGPRNTPVRKGWVAEKKSPEKNKARHSSIPASYDVFGDK